MGRLAVLVLEEQPGGSNMRLRKEGDRGMIALLLHAAMDVDREIAAACMAAVVQYCDAKGISCGELAAMAGTPSANTPKPGTDG